MFSLGCTDNLTETENGETAEGLSRNREAGDDGHRQPWRRRRPSDDGGDMEIRSNSPRSQGATRHAHTKRDMCKSRQNTDPNGIEG